jgi:sodium-dependent dicarboxylate transporter 2/3/5
MIGATMAASYGFMMPAGTPPNAIAFGSGYLRIWDMIRTGFVLNVVSILLITLLMMGLLRM